MNSQKAKRLRWWTIPKMVSALVFISALSAAGYRLYSEYDARNQLAQMYPKIEELVLIQSLVNWRKDDQLPPKITVFNNLGAGSREFPLSCKSIQWGTTKISEPGELFSCFREEVEHEFEGEKFGAPQLNTSGDYWYNFHWETLFGYEIEVEVIGDTGTSKNPLLLYEKLRTDSKQCLEENKRFKNVDELCALTAYRVTIKSPAITQPVSFAVSQYLFHSQDGAITKGTGWVLYLRDGLDPIRLQDLSRFLQLSFRELGIAETNLEKSVPQLQTLWLNKDRKFVSSLFSEIENLPDLVKLGDFLKPPK